MFKKNMLIPFIIIFIIIFVLGSIIEKPMEPTILDGTIYYGIPFTYYGRNAFTGYIHITNFSSLILNLFSWIVLSLLLTKIVLKIEGRS